MNMKEEEEKKRVVIVGGGMAGLGAAGRLIENGIKDFVILEARERLGGRVWSIEIGKENKNKDDGNKKIINTNGVDRNGVDRNGVDRNGVDRKKDRIEGIVVEMGAGWIHGEKGNVLYDLAKQHHLLKKQKHQLLNCWLAASNDNADDKEGKEEDEDEEDDEEEDDNEEEDEKEDEEEDEKENDDEEEDEKDIERKVSADKFEDIKKNEKCYKVEHKNGDVDDDDEDDDDVDDDDDDDVDDDDFVDRNNFIFSDGTVISDEIVNKVLNKFQEVLSKARFLSHSGKKERCTEVMKAEKDMSLLQLEKFRVEDVQDISIKQFVKKEFNQFIHDQKTSLIRVENKIQLDRNPTIQLDKNPTMQLDREFEMQEALLDWRLDTENIENGCENSDEIPVLGWDDYEICEGDGEVELDGWGYRGLIDVLVKRITDGCGCDTSVNGCEHVRLGCVVEQIEWGGKHCCEGCSVECYGVECCGVEGCGVECCGVECCGVEGCGDKENNNESIRHGVVVRLKGGKSLRADHVIITLPLGVLKKKVAEDKPNKEIKSNKSLVRKGCDNIIEDTVPMFLPRLPPCKIQSIENLSFGTANKIFLEFEEDFWPKGVFKSIYFVWRKDEKTELKCLKRWGRCVEDTKWFKAIQGFDCFNGSILRGWIGGKEAVEMEKEENEMVGEVCLELFRKFMPTRKIPRLLRTIKTTWFSDQFSRGSYSYRGFNSSYLDSLQISKALPTSQSPVLLFAGEACHPNFYSTTHGAYLSGCNQAQQIVDF